MTRALLHLLFALPLLAANPFVGDWALMIPEGGAVWLGVDDKGNELSVGLMWRGGTVREAENAEVRDGELHFESARVQDGKRFATQYVATLDGDRMTLVRKTPKPVTAMGKRQRPVPPAPNLARVRWGAPVKLFNGKDLSWWSLTNPSATNGWSVENGVLMNRAPGRHATPRVHYSNLRTDKEFEDFNLTLDFRVPPEGNSGVYLRGIYEVQVGVPREGPPTKTGPGSIFGRIAPSTEASRPTGEWQSFDITLVDRHVTVVLNGVKVIDNQPLRGCTGGALWSDVERPGPIYLQGDHTDVDFRDIVLRPAIAR